MRQFVIAVALGSAALGSAASASDGRPTVMQIEPGGSVAKAGVYRLDLGEPDDPKAPRAWQGPIRIVRDGGAACTVGEEVAIVERPLLLMAGHILTVTTYSGSESRLYAVDARSCAVRWTSPGFMGASRITADTVKLPGRPPVKVGADGLPAAR